MSVQRRPMNARDRAVWEDAEGSLWVPGETFIRGPHLKTSQMEREILVDYQAGAAKDGVVRYIYTRNAKKSLRTPRDYTFYETQIGGMANIARELRLTPPYRRSAKFAAQISKFKAYLALPRKQTHDCVTQARKLSRFF